MPCADNLKPVLENGLCISCGACIAADPDLKMSLNKERMIYEPDGPGNSVAASVCPSVSVDYDRLQTLLFGNADRTEHGVVKAVYLSQSRNRNRNASASSGGLIKELLEYYLDTARVDGVIVLDHVSGLLFGARLIDSRKNIEELPGSIYHNIPYHDALNILRKMPGRFVLVATPCQLEGIYNYIYKLEPRLREKIYSTVGLICGWSYTNHSISAICDYKGVPESSIDTISFRGGDAIGKLRIVLPGKKIEINRRRDADYIAAFDRSFNVNRCHLCVNHVNYLADIVVGDAWLRSTEDSKSGVSIVICRTDRAVESVRDLEDRGKTNNVLVSEAEIVESQSRSLVYGDFAYSYADFLRSRNRYCPDLHGPNRPFSRNIAERRIEKFDKELSIKQRLQKQRRYKALWWRKFIFDTPRYTLRLLLRIIRRFRNAESGRPEMRGKWPFI